MKKSFLGAENCFKINGSLPSYRFVNKLKRKKTDFQKSNGKKVPIMKLKIFLGKNKEKKKKEERFAIVKMTIKVILVYLQGC